MSISAPPLSTTSTLLQRYAALHGIPLASNAGSMQLMVDGQYQLRISALSAEGILISAYLRPLPPAGKERDDLLLAFARLACGTMKEQATTCSVDERERAVWLQLPAVTQSTQDIDDAVGVFVNSLAFWSKASPSL